MKKTTLWANNPELLKKGLVARCPDHPTYRGIRKPRVECKPCEVLYEARER